MHGSMNIKFESVYVKSKLQI